MMSTTAERIAAQCLGLRTRFVHRVVSRIYDEALRPHGLGGAQLNLLVGLVIAAPVRPGTLAQHFEMDKSTMSRNMQRLAERGWVEIYDDEDGRSQLLRPTPAGLRLLERIVPAWEQAQAETTALLGASLRDGLHQLPFGPTKS